MLKIQLLCAAGVSTSLILILWLLNKLLIIS